MKDTATLPLPVSIFLSRFSKISGSAASILLSSSPTFPGPLVPVSVHPGALVYLPLHDPTSASTLPAVKHQRQRGTVNFSKLILNIKGSQIATLSIQEFQPTRIMQLPRIMHLPATSLANNVQKLHKHHTIIKKIRKSIFKCIGSSYVNCHSRLSIAHRLCWGKL